MCGILLVKSLLMLLRVAVDGSGVEYVVVGITVAADVGDVVVAADVDVDVDGVAMAVCVDVNVV